MKLLQIIPDPLKHNVNKFTQNSPFQPIFLTLICFLKL